jgi:hypothetical protein
MFSYSIEIDFFHTYCHVTTVNELGGIAFEVKGSGLREMILGLGW